MKRVVLSLLMVLATGAFFACNNQESQEQNQQNKDGASDGQKDAASDDKTDGASEEQKDATSDDKTDGASEDNTDGDTQEENWCDATYNQHCEGNTIYWCDVESAEVLHLSCDSYEGRTCQEAKELNQADCVATCSTKDAEEKACSDESENPTTMVTLATAKCLETVNGGLGLFVTQRDTCTSCADLTCHVADEALGLNLEEGDVCVAGAFKERCDDNQMVYCDGSDDSTIVHVLDCEKKTCIRNADKNLVSCADDSSVGCELGKVRHACNSTYNNMAITYTCITDELSGKNFESASSMLCNNGCDNATGECAEEDEWR